MDRVEINRHFIDICHMQVCVEADVTDAEILEFCNCYNPSGTIRGWTRVVRDDPENPKRNPIPCTAHPERLHFLVAC